MSAEAKTIKTKKKIRSQDKQPFVVIARKRPSEPHPNRSRFSLVPFLTSTIIHLTFIFALTLIVLRGRGLGPNGFDFTVSTNSEVAVDQVAFELTTINPLNAVEPDAEADQSAAQQSSSSTASTQLST